MSDVLLLQCSRAGSLKVRHETESPAGPTEKLQMVADDAWNLSALPWERRDGNGVVRCGNGALQPAATSEHKIDTSNNICVLVSIVARVHSNPLIVTWPGPGSLLRLRCKITMLLY